MAISPNFTFICDFAVQTHWYVDPAEPVCLKFGKSGDLVSSAAWGGEGSGRASSGKSEGLVGPSPRFELSGGWLTIFPTEGFFRRLPLHWFSDAEPAQTRDWAAASFIRDSKEALVTARPSGDLTLKSIENANDIVSRRSYGMRDIASFSLCVGGALERVLQVGDELKFSGDAGGDFYYAVLRNSQMIFSAGSVIPADSGEDFAVWQEYDRFPNSSALEAKLKHHAGMPIAEWIDVHRPYVTVRVKDQLFRLLDGEALHIDRYYAFLARSNRNVPAISLDFTPRAVHAAGCLDGIDKESIVAAAQQLTTFDTRML
jgi:hypothetical protein